MTATATKRSRKPTTEPPPPTSLPPDDDSDPERKEVDNSLSKLMEERDRYKSQLTTVKRKLSTAQNKVREAQLDFENADKHRKNCKANLDKAIADELALVRRFVDGEQELPFPDDGKSKEAASNKPAAAPTGNDHAAAQPIEALLAKNIKKTAGKEAFDAAKGKGSPIGLSENQIELLKAADVNTIADLEKKMAGSDGLFLSHVKGFGPNAVDRVTDTLMAFRSVYPVPAAPEAPATSSPAAAAAPLAEAPQPEEWEQVANQLRDVITDCAKLKVDGPAECRDWCDSTTKDAEEVLNSVVETKAVRKTQKTAIENWTAGIARWKEPSAA